MFQKIKVVVFAIAVAATSFSTVAREHDYNKMPPEAAARVDASLNDDEVTGLVACETVITAYAPMLQREYGDSQPELLDNNIPNPQSFVVMQKIAKNLNIMLNKLPNHDRVIASRAVVRQGIKDDFSNDSVESPEDKRAYFAESAEGCLKMGIGSNFY